MRFNIIILSIVSILTACDGSKSHFGKVRLQEEASAPLFDERGQQPSVTGRWSMSNTPKNASVEITFNSDGTLRIYGKENIYDPNTRIKDVSGNWTINGNKIYITAPGEEEVGIMNILSLDSNSLVIHIEGEPEKEIMYLSRER